MLLRILRAAKPRAKIRIFYRSLTWLMWTLLKRWWWHFNGILPRRSKDFHVFPSLSFRWATMRHGRDAEHYWPVYGAQWICCSLTGVWRACFSSFNQGMPSGAPCVISKHSLLRCFGVWTSSSLCIDVFQLLCAKVSRRTHLCIERAGPHTVSWFVFLWLKRCTKRISGLSSWKVHWYIRIIMFENIILFL